MKRNYLICAGRIGRYTISIKFIIIKKTNGNNKAHSESNNRCIYKDIDIS